MYVKLPQLKTIFFSEFPDSGNKYSWRKVTTTVHNIIVGKLWVDHHGDMEIVGEQSSKGYKCHLKFLPYSYFTRDSQRRLVLFSGRKNEACFTNDFISHFRVKGIVIDPQKQVNWVLNGTWDDKMEMAPVISTEGSFENPIYRVSSSL